MATLYSAKVARRVARSSASGALSSGRSSASGPRGSDSKDTGRRAARSTRRGRGRGGGGMRWLGIALLIAVGVAVFAARTGKLPRSAEPFEPTPAAVAATPRPAGTPIEQGTPVPTGRGTPQAVAAAKPTT